MASPANSTGAPAWSPPGLAPALLAVLGLGFGASVFAEGFYDLNAWGPIGVGVMALLLALVVGVPARLRGPAAVALAALVFLWLWSWISTSWAESGEQAHVAAARWATYAAAFAVVLLLLRDRRHRQVVLAFTGAGVLVAALYVALTMLLGDGSSLFFGGRLRDPLGYPNGQAGYFLVGLWPFLALAEHSRKPLAAGIGMAGAFLVASMLLVGQTRGVLPGVAVSAVAVLLLVPGRGRRLWVLIVLGAGLALLSQPLLDVYQETPAADPNGLPEDVAQSAATAMLLGAALFGALWAGGQYLISGPLAGLTRDPERARALRSLATVAAVAIVGLAAIGAAAAIDDPVGKVKDQYDEFVNLKVQSKTDTRFFSGGGYRYDYWRIAWKQFKDHPLRGEGAGNYDTTYFLQRRTNEDIRQPHSIELQTLSELGLVGGVALLAFVLAVLAGLWSQSRRARDDDGARIIAVAAGGVFIAWLAHTSVDWLHIIPGVTGIALLAAAVLLSGWVSPGRSPLRGRIRLLATAAAALAILVASQAVARPTVANYLRVDAQDELRSDPVAALKRANQALAIEGGSMRALYAKSAAYARLDRYRDARAALVEATRQEPHDHLPWALLGDLAVRRGDLERARRDYRRALRLNPNFPRLEQLVKDPRLAVTEAP